jgi:phosphatidylinositol alpha 1,6-mannosyltransferase
MRIALFTDTYLPQTNGVAVYIHDAIRTLSKEHEVILFAPGEGKLRTEQKAPDFRIHWIPSVPFPFYEGYRIASMDYRKIGRMLGEEKPDIVHAHAPINLGLQGILAAKGRKIPTVITYHTHFPDYVPHVLKLPGPLKAASEHAVKKMIKHVFKHADVVAAPSRELARELKSYGLRNVDHIPNGVDMSTLACTKAAAASFRKAHRIPARKVVLYFGRISFEKRLDVLLEAFCMMEREDSVLVIAGGGPYLKNFKDLAKAMNLRNVIFTGFVENKAAAYACGDIFASASDSETFGLTFVEAMHMGLPVVGVKRLGPKEIISENKTGLLVEPSDPAGLAGAMSKLLSDKKLRQKMGKQGRIASQKYTIEASVDKTLRIYRRLLRKAGRSSL